MLIREGRSAAQRATRGDQAVVRMTGLRNPCQQINSFEPGLPREVLGHAVNGSVGRKDRVMAVAVGGSVRAGQIFGCRFRQVS